MTEMIVASGELVMKHLLLSELHKKTGQYSRIAAFKLMNSPPQKWKPGNNARRPAWMNNKFLAKLSTKRKYTESGSRHR